MNVILLDSLWPGRLRLGYYTPLARRAISTDYRLHEPECCLIRVAIIFDWLASGTSAALPRPHLCSVLSQRRTLRRYVTLSLGHTSRYRMRQLKRETSIHTDRVCLRCAPVMRSSI
ncbi:hypothetical protein IF1G_07941 [Cordyceps javanica]|uniref:Uncharacterized protein n=1 Tax=Cordyceps javanica TaxID=43265 RepID=A0A545UV65_9HYPO|nr:hypothetical protein IF1G_07941 [Cordyceps javanica]